MSVPVFGWRMLRLTTAMPLRPDRLRASALCTAILVAVGTALGTMVAAAARTTWDSVFTDEQAVDGGTLYQERCSVCHGTDLEGGEDAPSLVGAQFSVIWDGRTLGDLVGFMQARMPPDAPGALGGDAYTNIVSFMLRRNGFPAGSAKLSGDKPILDGIRYLITAR